MVAQSSCAFTYFKNSNIYTFVGNLISNILIILSVWHQTSINRLSITKTCLYIIDPLQPHFYIVKLGFTRVYIIFLISAQNMNCRYSLEPPRRGGSNEYPQSMFWAGIWKISEFFIWKFSVFGGEFSVYLNRPVFVMLSIHSTQYISKHSLMTQRLRIAY